MKIQDLTIGNIGQRITVHHGKSVITGQFQDIDPEMIDDYRLCDVPWALDQQVAGYTLTIGGWRSPLIRPNAEVEVEA